MTPNTGLDPAGDTVTVSGVNYNPNQAIYVFPCADIELPANLWNHASNCRSGAKVIYPVSETNPDRAKFTAAGSFEIEFDVSALNVETTAVFTAANHTAMSNRGQDAKAVLSFAPAHATTTGLTVSPVAPVFGDAVTLTAQVSPATAAGTVAFFDGETQIGEAVIVADGVAELTTGDLSAASHSITARFTPTNPKAFAPSQSDAQTLVVKATTVTTLAVPSTVELGKTATLTATVSPAVAGTVSFYVNGDQLGDAVAVNDGVASVTTEALENESYDFEAIFTPADTANYVGSDSQQTVTAVDHEKATASINGETTLVLAPGDEVVFTAGEFAVGTEVSAEIHSDPILLGAQTVGANGMASYTWTVPANFSGTHSIIFTTAGGTVITGTFTVDPASGKGGLSVTGSESLVGLSAAAMVMLLLGAGLMIHRRRVAESA